jgi:hypothetical protein
LPQKAREYNLSFTPGFSPVELGNRSQETVLTVSLVAAYVISTYAQHQRRAEEETVKTVSRFLSSFDTGLKPGVNERVTAFKAKALR